MREEAREPAVAAVILNYRRPDDTIRCVRSLEESVPAAPRVIVVDNGSGEQCTDRLLEELPGADIIISGENLGYAAGNNRGIRAALDAGADYIFVINNDCTVAPEAVSRMIGSARARGAGIVSPKVYDFQSPREIQYAGYRNIHLLAQGVAVGEGQVDRGQFDEPRELDAAPGCAMLLSRKLIEEVGLFDEQFFAYSEELDLCRRARERGFTILFEPGARVRHRKGATLGTASAEYLYLLTRGRLIYARKHLGWPAFLGVFMPYFIAAKVTKPCIVHLLKGQWAHLSALIRAIEWNLSHRVCREGVNVKLQMEQDERR